MLCARLGSGSGIGNKAIIISAKQQSHTEEYGVVHGSSNHTRKNTKEYGVHVERIVAEYIAETAVSRTTALMNVKVILQVAYMSAFRPSFCLNGSFVSHRHTHTDRTDHSTPAQARGKNDVLICLDVCVLLHSSIIYSQIHIYSHMIFSFSHIGTTCTPN